MKILFIIKSLTIEGGGAEKVFCTTVNNLHDYGFPVEILTFDNRDKKTFYYLKKDIKHARFDIGDASKKTRLLDSITKIIKLRNYLIKKEPSVVVSFMNSSFTLAAIANFGLKPILIASEHIVYQHYASRPIQKFFYYLTNFLINKYIIVSVQAKKTFPFFIQKKMFVIENPISSIKLDEYSIQKEKIILNVGRLEDQKDHLTLIKAFNIAIKNHKDWKLLIIGNGKNKKQLINEINNLNISNNVTIMSFQKNIIPFYLKSSLYVSTSHYESHGLTVSEALNCKLPAIAFNNCAGLNIIIKNNFNGILVDSNNKILNLSKTLKVLFKDIMLINTLANNINEVNNTNFVKQKWIDFINSVKN